MTDRSPGTQCFSKHACKLFSETSQARRLRKSLGGGMRQAGVIAAAGLEAVVNNYTRLQEVTQVAGLFVLPLRMHVFSELLKVCLIV